MIATRFHQGQGLGNQLWCYVTTRCIALDKGYGFGIISPEKFKGADFMSADMGAPIHELSARYAEKGLIHAPTGSDVRDFDPGLANVADDTELEGLMQDERYIERHRAEIKEWLRVKPEYDCRDFSSDGICVINFRGGGYARDPLFFLPPSYWKNCIREMRRINPAFRFVVVSDDVPTAKMFFPDFDVFHWSIGKDYAVIKNAKYLILSNSSFAWFPAWLSDDLKLCIAPKYWARHNVSDGYWSLGYNLTKGWKYMDRTGRLQTFEECRAELDAYQARPSRTLVLDDGSAPRPSQLALAISIFSALRADFGALAAARRVTTVTLVHAMLQSKDRLKKMLGMSLAGPQYLPAMQAPAAQASAAARRERLSKRMRAAAKRFFLTRGYY